MDNVTQQEFFVVYFILDSSNVSKVDKTSQKEYICIS